MIYDKDIPEIIIKLEKLIGAVRENLPKACNVVDQLNTSRPGFYIKDKDGQKVLWFGLWHEFWKDDASHTPIVVGVGADWQEPVIANLKKKYTSEEYKSYLEEDEWDWYIIPMPKKFLDRLDVAEITGWLLQIIKDLAT